MPNTNKDYKEEISRGTEMTANPEKNKVGPQGSKTLQHMGSITLEEALEVFEYPSLLKDLDNSLEMVRKGEKKKEQHEQYCNDFDRKLRRRSLLYHSDRIMNKGETEGRKIAAAEEIQKVLNAVRIIIKSLNTHFCEDIDVEYKYSFYAKITINLLNNGKELEQISFKMLTKLSKLAEIKQEGIIAKINEFLKSSQASMENFVANNLDEFRREKDRAMCCLGSCVCRYGDFVKGLKLIEEDCCKDQGLESMRSSITEMLKEAQNQENILKTLEEFSMKQSQGKWKPFKLNNEEKVDKYFVLPFIEYVNVLLMCSNAQGEEINKCSLPFYVKLIDSVGNVTNRKCREYREWTKKLFKDNPEEEVHEIEKDDVQKDLYSKSYYLMCYLNEDTQYEETVANFLNMRKDELNKEVVKLAFTKEMKTCKDYLVNKFKPECYVEGGMRKRMRELSKHMNVIDELIKKTKQDLFRMDKTTAYVDDITTNAAKQEQQTDDAINFLERLVSNTEGSIQIKPKEMNTVKGNHGIINQVPSTSQQKILNQSDSRLGTVSVNKIVSDAEKREQQVDKAISFLEGLSLPDTEASAKVKQKKMNAAKNSHHDIANEGAGAI